MAKYLSITEVEDELGVPKSTLAEWRADGRFPRGRKMPNGRVLIARADFDAWLDALAPA